MVAEEISMKKGGIVIKERRTATTGDIASFCPVLFSGTIVSYILAYALSTVFILIFYA